MKSFTIAEALKEIEVLGFELDLTRLTAIRYEDGSRNKFICEFSMQITPTHKIGNSYFVNLDAGTYHVIK